MALNPQQLADLIRSKTEQHLSGLDPRDPGNASAIDAAQTLALAEAIVEHIQAAAQVLPGIPVATSGSPGSHTGATTAPGVIQ
ncbi:MAG: hypothetical protein WC326_16325 [Candidatus Delongbacteria bacterium]